MKARSDLRQRAPIWESGWGRASLVVAWRVPLLNAGSAVWVSQRLGGTEKAPRGARRSRGYGARGGRKLSLSAGLGLSGSHRAARDGIISS